MARRTRSAPAPTPEAVPAAEDAPPAEPAPPPGLGYEKWIGFLSNFIAPATLITALLFYFGYVSSREFFLYFGVDVDVLDFSNQQFVMRSPGAVFVPVMVILLIAAAAIVGHRLLRARLRTATPRWRRRTIALFAWSGIVLMLAGLVLAFSYAALSSWPYYGFATAMTLGSGAGLAAYAAQTARTLSGATQGRALVVLLVAVMVAGAFWATAAVAQWWGRGQARTLAADLSVLPAVVLDAKDRVSPGTSEITAIRLDQDFNADGTPVAGQFRYRYQGLRLLVRGGDYLFLVPDAWSADASTLVIPIDPANYRVRYRFLPDDVPPG
ncbi:hypothetical protein [Microbacterium sp.]|uniref:hypothetical protein n=1 Tax=Microbacterium sp. TaxID=51671 RepID=UPI0037C56A7D